MKRTQTKIIGWHRIIGPIASVFALFKFRSAPRRGAASNAVSGELQVEHSGKATSRP